MQVPCLTVSSRISLLSLLHTKHDTHRKSLNQHWRIIREVSYDAFICRLLFLSSIKLWGWLCDQENKTHDQESATTWCFFNPFQCDGKRKTFPYDSFHTIIYTRSISLPLALDVPSLLFRTSEVIILVIIRYPPKLVLREQTDTFEKVFYAWYSRVATLGFSSKWRKAASAMTLPSCGMMFE